MKITVAICTWNRASMLRQTLEQFTRIRPPASEWELIVVNNNSSDNTPAVVDAFAGRLPIRSFVEKEQGLSAARNAAVANATGDYLFWTDDDVLVGDDWLVDYEAAIRRWPDVAIFGGPIEPWFDGTPPDWLVQSWKHIEAAFGTRDLGDYEGLIDEGVHCPFGANFVVRMAEQRRHLYDVRLGRKAGGGALGEETAVISAVLNEPQGRGQWVKTARVRHWVPRSRQTIRYIWEYFFLQGKTIALNEARDARVTLLLGRPRWMIFEISRSLAKTAVAMISGRPSNWVERLCELARYCGRFSVDRR